MEKIESIGGRLLHEEAGSKVETRCSMAGMLAEWLHVSRAHS